MIVANLNQNNNQTRTKITTLKLTILQLLSKNKKEHNNSFGIILLLQVKEKILVKHHIFTTLKATKTLLSTHKLHSLHSFI